MRRVLSRIGIGASTVDTVLPRTELAPGETVSVDVELYGGGSRQEISGIHLVLTARDDADGEHELVAYHVDEPVSLEPDEERTIRAEVEVPLWAPVTAGGVSVWLGTRLDIDWARDPTDEDRVEVVPDEAVSALFEALDDMGFALRGSELVDVPHVEDRPLAQRFRFEPTGGQYDEALDAIEVTVMPRSDDLRAFVEFDRAGTIADEHGMDFDKQEVSMTFERTSVAAIRGRLEAGIERHG
jgi:sporulation-control protein